MTIKKVGHTKSPQRVRENSAEQMPHAILKVQAQDLMDNL